MTTAEAIALCVGFLGLISGVLSFFASLNAAEIARRTAKEVAERTAETNKNVVEMNAKFSENLKQKEFRLAHLTQLAKRRIEAYDRAVEFVTSVHDAMEVGDDKFRHVLTDPMEFIKFIARSNSAKMTIWLRRDTALMLMEWYRLAFEYSRAMVKALKNQKQPEELSEYRTFVEKTGQLIRAMLRDYAKLDNLEELEADIIKAEESFLMYSGAYPLPGSGEQTGADEPRLPAAESP